MFGVAIAKRQIAALRVTVGGDVPPRTGVTPKLKRRHPKSGIENSVFMHVQKNPELGGGWVSDLGELFETRILSCIRVQFRGAVDAEVHVVTANAKLREFGAATRFRGRTVS